MSFSDTNQAKKYASIAEVAASECKLLTEEARRAPEYTNEAKEYAERAEQASSSAASSASQALNAANGASSNAGAAQDSANAAMLSEQQASDSASAAANSENNAGQSEASAAQSASDAEATVTNTLRVSDGPLGVLPVAADRALKVLSCDASGNFQFLTPSSGSAEDVLNQLAESTGSDLIGYGSGTVTDELDTIKVKLDGDASFTSGASLTSVKEFIWDDNSKSWYYWTGSYPKDVPPLSSPSSTGGVIEGAWAEAGSDELKKSITNTTGASIVGAIDENGESSTVQDELDSLSAKTVILSSPHRKKVAATYPWVFPDYNSIITQYSYTQMIPQGVAVDGEYIYSLYWVNGTSPQNHWTWVAVWKLSSQEYISCFYLPSTLSSSFSEGGYVRVINGVKVLYTEQDGLIKGFDITTLPSNKGTPSSYGTPLGNLATFESFGAGSNGLAIIQKNTNHRRVLMTDWNNNPKGVATLSPVVGFIGVDNSSSYQTSRIKVQGRTLGESQLFLFGGGQYYGNGLNQFPLAACNFIRANMDGSTREHYAYDPYPFIRKLTGLDESIQLGGVECEGATTSPDGKIYSQWYYEISSPYSVHMLLIEEDSSSIGSVDVSDTTITSLAGTSDPDMFIQSYDTSNAFNPYTNTKLTSVNDVCEMMRSALIDRLNIYCSGDFPIFGSNIVPNSTMINLYRTAGSTIFMQLTGPTFQRTITSTASGQFTYNKFQIGGIDTDAWFGTGDFVIAGLNNLGVVATRRAGTAASIHYRFQNDNGTVGTIQTTGSTTTYGTSSDERLKIRIGEITNAESLINNIVDGGAIANAHFISEPDNPYGMFMAQSLREVFPQAVMESIDMDDGNGNVTHIPMNVDYSKINPYLVQVCYNLLKRVAELEEMKRPSE